MNTFKPLCASGFRQKESPQERNALEPSPSLLEVKNSRLRWTSQQMEEKIHRLREHFDTLLEQYGIRWIQEATSNKVILIFEDAQSDTVDKDVLKQLQSYSDSLVIAENEISK